MSETTTTIDRYGVVGYPVAHSRSPVIHQIFARQTGQSISYDLIETAPEQLESTIGSFRRGGGRGLNVTVPHKSDVVRLVDKLSDNAAAAGAVNTLTFTDDSISGDNTDGIGLVRDLSKNKRWPIAGKRILILGAGGSTRGIVRPLCSERPAGITIANRSASKAVALAAHFSTFGQVSSARFEELDTVEPFDIVINATSAGLDGKLPEFPVNIINESSACYDLSYGASSTPFLSWARKRRVREYASGWGMLVEQAAESFRIWRGVMPNTADVLRHYNV